MPEGRVPGTAQVFLFGRPKAGRLDRKFRQGRTVLPLHERRLHSEVFT